MKPVEMKVRLVKTDMLTRDFWDVIDGTKLEKRESDKLDAENWEALDDGALLAEAAGRKCYESWNLPREATATNAKYMRNIMAQFHFSILEHATYTFYIEGVSRATLAELTRHRHLSFSVRSQRFVDESDSDYVIPQALLENRGYPEVEYAIALIKAQQQNAQVAYRQIQHALENVGVASRKVRNDAARYVLPEATETKFFVTGNGRAWLEFLVKRKNPHAAMEIRDLATRIHRHLAQASPTIFEEDE